MLGEIYGYSDKQNQTYVFQYLAAVSGSSMIVSGVMVTDKEDSEPTKAEEHRKLFYRWWCGYDSNFDCRR